MLLGLVSTRPFGGFGVMTRQACWSRDIFEASRDYSLFRHFLYTSEGDMSILTVIPQ